MQNSLIVRKFAGQAIPDAYIEKFLTQYSTTWGAAFLTDDNQIVLAKQDQGITKEELDDLQIHTMDKEAVFFFSQAMELQPYPLIEIEGKYKLVAFLEGNFKKMLNDGETISNENALVEKWLKPRVQKIHGFNGGDMEKVRAEIEDDDELTIFKSKIEDRGTFVLLFPDGPYTIAMGNPAAGSYAWGAVSNNLGYTEGMEKVEEPVKEPEKPKSIMDRFSSGVSAVATAAAAVVGKAPPPPKPKTETASAPPLAARPAAPPPPPKPKTAEPFPKGAANPSTLPATVPAAAATSAAATEMVYWRIKDKASNNNKKDMYKLAKLHVGGLDAVPDWKLGPIVEIPRAHYEANMKKFNSEGSLVDLKSLTAELQAKFSKGPVKPGEIRATSTAPDGTSETQTVKSSVPAVAPPPPLPKPKATETQNIPSLILPAERRKEILAQDVSVLDKNSIKIDDPTLMGELVSKHPSLDMQLGKGRFWEAWSPASLLTWCAKNSDAASIIIFHQNVELARLRAQVAAQKSGTEGQSQQRKAGVR